MARLEDLIKDIADARLRNQIAAEVGKLKARKKFGLVFEQHLPEVVQLPGLPVKPGTRVAKRTDKNAGFFLVTDAVNGKKVSILPERGGGEEVFPKDELVVVKRFGEPMYPALVPVDRITRAPGKPFHTLINADNFHALQVLLYCYEGCVDAIYIDPPYNSGARDWKYNNDYVDRADQYRHSKWLSMMKRRLELAKRLLKRDGVLIVTIDENEVGHLSVLLESIFPEYLRHMVSAVINPKGTGKLNFARVDEYVFFCVPNLGKISVIKGMPTEAGITGAPGEGALFYPSSQPRLEGMEPDDEGEDADDEQENGEADEEIDIEEVGGQGPAISSGGNRRMGAAACPPTRQRVELPPPATESVLSDLHRRKEEKGGAHGTAASASGQTSDRREKQRPARNLAHRQGQERALLAVHLTEDAGTD